MLILKNKASFVIFLVAAVIITLKSFNLFLALLKLKFFLADTLYTFLHFFHVPLSLVVFLVLSF